MIAEDTLQEVAWPQLAAGQADETVHAAAPNLDAALDYARGNARIGLAELKELIAIPSVSVSRQHEAFVKTAAQWLSLALKLAGLERIEVFPGQQVYAESAQRPGRPTFLFYGHFDVGFVAPIDELKSFPFDPVVKSTAIMGHGVADMKGALWAMLQAIEAVNRREALAVNLKVLLDSEQKIGSPGMADLISRNPGALTCDAAFNLDGEMAGPGVPCIDYAGRGLAEFEIRVNTARTPLHSGRFGGAVPNAAQVLCGLIAGMIDARGRVLLPRFYNRVRPITRAERCAFAATGEREEEWLKKSGAAKLFGDDQFTPDERVKLRPALEVTDFETGLPPRGVDADIPASATARVSAHLVPDQDPGAVFDQVYEYVSGRCPHHVSWEVREIARVSWHRAKLDSLSVRAASKALKEVFGVQPLLRRSGSSDRFMGLFQKHAGIGPVSMGFRIPDPSTRAGNERQHLPTLMKGIEAMVRLLADPQIVEEEINRGILSPRPRAGLGGSHLR